jgi:hypothetical protein
MICNLEYAKASQEVSETFYGVSEIENKKKTVS